MGGSLACVDLGEQPHDVAANLRVQREPCRPRSPSRRRGSEQGCDLDDGAGYHERGDNGAIGHQETRQALLTLAPPQERDQGYDARDDVDGEREHDPNDQVAFCHQGVVEYDASLPEAAVGCARTCIAERDAGSVASRRSFAKNATAPSTWAPSPCSYDRCALRLSWPTGAGTRGRFPLSDVERFRAR